MTSAAKPFLAILAITLALCLATMPTAGDERTNAASPAAPASPPAAGCWAQAGRVLGGFWGAIGATAISPWVAGSAWSTYTAVINNEPKDDDGHLLC